MSWRASGPVGRINILKNCQLRIGKQKRQLIPVTIHDEVPVCGWSVIKYAGEIVPCAKDVRVKCLRLRRLLPRVNSRIHELRRLRFK